jgi:hypothetical protein
MKMMDHNLRPTRIGPAGITLQPSVDERGYQPLDEGPLDDSKLLCITAEVLYRTQTGDDA